MDRLASVRAKIERAEQHVRDAEGAIRAFRDFNPYEVGEKLDPQTGQCVYYMVRVDDVQPYIGNIIGDALHNLRSALDHLAYAMWVASGSVGNPKRIYYPIIDTDSRTVYESSRSGKVQGIAPRLRDMMDATEPYKGGAGHDLWVLNELDNIDKHRRLNVIVAAFGGFWVHPVVRQCVEECRKANPGIIATAMPPGYYYRPLDRNEPLKVGDELYRCPAQSKLDQYDEFAFEVAFSEPPVVECQPVVEFLQKATHLVSGIVDRFTPHV